MPADREALRILTPDQLSERRDEMARLYPHEWADGPYPCEYECMACEEQTETDGPPPEYGGCIAHMLAAVDRAERELNDEHTRANDLSGWLANATREADTLRARVADLESGLRSLLREIDNDCNRDNVRAAADDVRALVPQESP